MDASFTVSSEKVVESSQGVNEIFSCNMEGLDLTQLLKEADRERYRCFLQQVLTTRRSQKISMGCITARVGRRVGLASGGL